MCKTPPVYETRFFLGIVAFWVTQDWNCMQKKNWIPCWLVSFSWCNIRQIIKIATLAFAILTSMTGWLVGYRMLQTWLSHFDGGIFQHLMSHWIFLFVPGKKLCNGYSLLQPTLPAKIAMISLKRIFIILHIIIITISIIIPRKMMHHLVQGSMLYTMVSNMVILPIIVIL